MFEIVIAEFSQFTKLNTRLFEKLPNQLGTIEFFIIPCETDIVIEADLCRRPIARFEVLSPETEEKLAALMREEKPNDQTAKDFKALNLGRFANGAAELVSDREKSKALGNYSQLFNQSAELEKKD